MNFFPCLVLFVFLWYNKEKKEEWHITILCKLFFTFFVLGASSFGGGYAMLPYLQRDIVEKHGWTTEEELRDYFAIGQCTPGIIAVNVATFVGQKTAGTVGGIVATVGLVSPCIVLISLIATFFENFDTMFASGFMGIKACVVVLVAGAAYKLWKEAVVDLTTGRIFYVVFALMTLGKLYENPVLDWVTSPILLVLTSGVVGLLCGGKGAEK